MPINVTRRGPWPRRRSTASLSYASLTISGVTRDSSGNPLPACTVDLFDTLTNTLQQSKTSGLDGSYTFAVNNAQQYYVVAYKQGTPDVSGTTVNTLVAS